MSKEANSEQTLQNSERATRFALQWVTHYRAAGDQEWHRGETENISRTGVLFRGAHPLIASAPVEMRFVLPMVSKGEPRGELVCRGTVVRVVPPSDWGPLPAFGVAISAFRFHRGRVPP